MQNQGKTMLLKSLALGESNPVNKLYHFFCGDGLHALHEFFARQSTPILDTRPAINIRMNVVIVFPGPQRTRDPQITRAFNNQDLNP